MSSADQIELIAFCVVFLGLMAYILGPAFVELWRIHQERDH